MKFPARILGVFLSLLVVLFFVHSTFAQTPILQQTSPAQQYLAPNTDANVPNNLHAWSQNVILEVMSAVVCQLVGVDPINSKQQCLGIDQQTGKLGYVNNGGGAIGMVSGMVGGLYAVPIRFGDYVAYTSNDFGLVKQAHAQLTGIGYNGLLPILNLWKVFRNLAYLLFVLVFVVIGIAIMLRVNIDARTVMTIQNQIPKLIIGIVLVTFSYAIAGFLIDLMWVGNYVVVNTIAQGSTSINTDNVMSQATQGAPGFANYILAPANGSPFGGIIGVTAGSASGIGDIIQNLFSPNNISPNIDTTTTDCGWNPLCNIGNFLNFSIQNLIGNIIGLIISWIARILAFLIIAIAILWALIKLWLSLIKAYVFVLIDVVIAPFWIVAGIFPKAPPSLGFGSWLRDLIANLSVFPTILALFMFARIILDNFGSGSVSTQFNPPLIGNPGGTNGIAPLIALGIILMAPGIADAIKKALKTSGVPTGFGGAAVGAAAMGAVGGAISRRMYWKDSQGNTHGLAANAQRYATQRLYNSRVGSPLRKYADNPNSRLNRWFGYTAEKQKTEREARQRSRDEAANPPVRDYSAERGTEGKQGPKGDTGPQGPQGPAAPPAT